MENRQDDRLYAAVRTAFPSVPAGDRRLSLEWWRLESWDVWVPEIDMLLKPVGCFPPRRREKCGHLSFRATGGVLGSAAGHRWGLPPWAPRVGSLERRGRRHQPFVSEKSGQGDENREQRRPCSRPLRGGIVAEERRGQGPGNARGQVVMKHFTGPNGCGRVPTTMNPSSANPTRYHTSPAIGCAMVRLCLV